MTRAGGDAATAPSRSTTGERPVPRGTAESSPRHDARRLEEARRLDRAILAAVDRGWNDPLDEKEFDQLAVRLYHHQRRHNLVLRSWWSSAAAPAQHVRGWRDVAPLPVAAYKQARVAAFPADGTAGTEPRFLSSGTTASERSRVFIETPELYEAALVPPFRRFCVPDLRPGERMRLVFLAPSPISTPASSLSHMFGVLRDVLGTRSSAFVGDAGVLDVEALIRVLAEAVPAQPTFLLGPSFAFVHALEALAARGARFALPEGSRIFQTGGFKGRSGEVERGDLLARYGTTLGIPPERVIDEYGMAELASQFYAGQGGPFLGPPWVRWRVLDPLTLEPVAEGEPGLLAVWDLANRSHCFALRTEDVVTSRDEGFELLGRAPVAVGRGCSLDAVAVTSSPARAISVSGEPRPDASPTGEPLGTP